MAIQFGHSAFFKKKADAVRFAKKNGARMRRTTHFIKGKGWLVYK